MQHRRKAETALAGPVLPGSVPVDRPESAPDRAPLDSRAAKLCFSALIFASYLFFSPVLAGAYNAEGQLSGGGDTLRQVVFVALFLAIAATTFTANGIKAFLNVPLALVAVLLWCWASVAWAIVPDVALRRVLFTTIVILGVTYSVNLLSYRAAASILCTWFAAILMLDWLAMPFWPQAVHGLGEIDRALIGNWRGIHDHKNEAGAFCALASLVFIDKWRFGRSTISAPLLTVLSLVFLAMTESKTSAGLLPAAILLGVLMSYGYRNPTLRAAVLAAVGCVALLAAVALWDDLPSVLAFFENPASLTGRVQIWPVLLDYAANHLLLGAGYGSFWAIGDASPVYQSGARWLTTISHAHNGYIDLLVQTGLVGVTLAVLGLVVRPAFLLISRPMAVRDSRWLLGSVLAFCWLHNLLESSLLDRANIVWVTMLIALNLLERRPPALSDAPRAIDREASGAVNFDEAKEGA